MNRVGYFLSPVRAWRREGWWDAGGVEWSAGAGEDGAVKSEDGRAWRWESGAGSRRCRSYGAGNVPLRVSTNISYLRCWEAE